MPSKGRFMMLHPPSPVPFRHGLGNSIEMLRVALDYFDIRVESSTLAGSSGAAFRIHWPQRGEESGSAGPWDSDPASVSSIDPLTAACAPHGWKVLWYRGISGTVGWQFVCQSLERAKPVVSYGFIGEPEHTLIVGYDRTEKERRLFVLTRHAPDPLPFTRFGRCVAGNGREGICVGLLEAIPAHRRPSPEQAIHRSLRRVVWQSKERTLRAPARYGSGSAAYSSWIDDLLARGPRPGAATAANRVLAAYRIGHTMGDDQLERIGLRHTLHRSLVSFAEARRWASSYLRGPARTFHTGRAALEYDGEASALESAAEFWPPVVRSAPGRFHLAPEPDGFEERERLEETVRCLRIAAESNVRAEEEIMRCVPPAPQEEELNEQGRGEGV